MKTSRKFWNFVKERLVQIHKKPFGKWQRKWMEDTFIPKVNETVKIICKSDKEKAKLVTTKLGQFKSVSYQTFRKVLTNKKKDELEAGSENTRNVFAIYLDYKSYDHCVEEENLYGIDDLEKRDDSILALLKKYYKEDFLFNTIRISGDKDGVLGKLSMKDYYTALSYIDYKELKSRASLIQKEQESASRKVNRNSFDKQWIGTDYLSEDILLHNKRIVIIGNPGVGKSTYARWFCYQWASDQSDISVIPIYVQLRDLEFVKGKKSILEYVKQNYLPNTDLNEIEKNINQNFHKYLFLFDGFDELKTENKDKFENELLALTRPRGKIQFVLLSRPYGLLHRQLNQDLLLQIDGFTISSIENYVRLFLDQHTSKYKSKDELLEIIQKNPILSEYAYNPLMLSYIVLIYLTNDNPRPFLLGIASQYDLQLTVFRWMKDYAAAHPLAKSVTEEEVFKANQVAYELLFDQEFSYRSGISNYIFPKSLAISLNQMGLGAISEDRKTLDWHFSFNTVTFQEFMAVDYCQSFLNVSAFVYLLQDHFFWNFAKLMLGALSEKGTIKTIDSIFDLMESTYEKEEKDYLKYLYYNLLSETNSNFINNRLKEKDLNTLFEFYQDAYFDPYWKLFIQESLHRIYYKLSSRLKKQFHELLTKKVLELQSVEHQVRGGATLAYTLFDLSNLTEISSYQPFVKIMFDTVEVLAKQSYQIKKDIEKLDDDDELFGAVSRLDNEDIEVNNTAFIIYQILVHVPEHILKLFKNRVAQLKSMPTLDVWMDIEKVEAKIQTSEKSIIEYLRSIEICKQLPESETVYSSVMELEEKLEEKRGDLDEDVQELPISEMPRMLNFPIELLKLAGGIFKLGYSKANIDLSKIEEGVKLYLRKVLHPDYIANEAIKESADLIITGLEYLNEEAVWDMLFDFIHQMDISRLLDIEKDDLFKAYLQQKLIVLEKKFNLTEFDRLTTALKSTKNGKFGLLQFRSALSSILFKQIEQNRKLLSSQNLELIIEDKNNPFHSVVEKILFIPYFVYDKKYFIDGILDSGLTYSYLRHYVLPLLFEDEFPFFQDKYWEFIEENYHKKLGIPLQILDILFNDGIYSYSSNLPHLYKILSHCCKIVEDNDEFNNDEINLEIQSYAHPLTHIISNTLILLKRSSPPAFKQQLIHSTGVLLERTELKAIYLEEGYLETCDANDLLPYILQFAYTQDTAFQLPMPYQEFKVGFPKEHRKLLITLIDLFSNHHGMIDHKELQGLQPVLGDSFYTDVMEYIENYKILYFQFERKVYEELLKNKAAQ